MITAVLVNVLSILFRSFVNSMITPFPDKSATETVVCLNHFKIIFVISGSVSHRMTVFAQDHRLIRFRFSVFFHLLIERTSRWNELITDNPEYEEAVLDRVKKMIERDKNRPCVVIWSMGNESGYGCTTEKALAWTKAYDPGRLTHYEGALHKGKKRRYDYSNLDLYSRMYPLYEQVEEY